MKISDYLVVGLGIAGIGFCEQLRKRDKSFIVFSDKKPGATAKSGGILNPTILKFFTAVSKSAEFYPEALSFYKDLNAIALCSKQIAVYRIFSNIREQNNWIVATDKKRTKNFLSPELIKNTNPNIQAPLGFGEVTAAIQMDVSLLLAKYADFLTNQNQLKLEAFEYNHVEIGNDFISYRGYRAKHIVFCDGIAALNNPFFPKDKLYGNMGEYLIIKSPELKLETILKGPFYIIPLGNDRYKVGATFNSGILSVESTKEGEREITAGLDSMISCDYEIIKKTSGVRPTAPDRNPMVGSLRNQKQVGFINGLGSRGFLMAPLLGKLLFQHLENQVPIPSEFDINRTFEDRLG